MEKAKHNPFSLEVVSVRLVKDAPLLSGQSIRTPEDVVALLGNHMCALDREVICVINLRNDGVPINCHFASMGAINQAIAHPRELFKASILSNAAHMMLIHNHPSGSLKPSREDTRITDRMINLCEHIGIPLLDHVIVGGENREYFSFKEKQLLPIPKTRYEDQYELLEFPKSYVAEKARAR